jgi:hypothetical protein
MEGTLKKEKTLGQELFDSIFGVLKDCGPCPEKNKNTNEIVVLSFQTWNSDKDIIRAIPRNRGVSEIASFLLTTGDLPAPRQAKKMEALNKCQTKEREC